MQAQELHCKIVSIGTWGSHFEDWDALKSLLLGSDTPTDKLKGPKPQVIPANERRRAPLPVRLAVESSWQATQEIDLDPNELTCVFVSGLGDTDLTDYMCKVLASENKELSPTKFHNSVHNAPAGYWTISTKSMGAANSIAGFEQSVSLTLMEALIQCEVEKTPILVTLYDAPVSTVLRPLLENEEPFALSLVIVPQDHKANGIALRGKVNSGGDTSWPKLNSSNTFLQSLYQTNPSAKILSLVEMIANQNSCDMSITMPLSSGSSITFSLNEDSHG